MIDRFIHSPIDFSDGRDGGRGGGDKAGDQRVEEVQPPPQHCHLLRGVHQEVSSRQGKGFTIITFLQFCSCY